MNSNTWPFSDPPNVAVFTDSNVLSGETWIHYVSHDSDGGAWQFHGPGRVASETSAKVVALKSIVALDGSITLLADLPLGWCAWRDTKESPWQRAVKPT